MEDLELWIRQVGKGVSSQVANPNCPGRTLHIDSPCRDVVFDCNLRGHPSNVLVFCEAEVAPDFALQELSVDDRPHWWVVALPGHPRFPREPGRGWDRLDQRLKVGLEEKRNPGKM